MRALGSVLAFLAFVASGLMAYMGKYDHAAYLIGLAIYCEPKSDVKP